MLLQLFFALAVASLTVVVHAMGTLRIVMPLAGVWGRWEGDPTSARTMLMLTRLVGGLLVLHLTEMTIWAAAFRAAGVMPTFESSLYYSLERYTTVGYGVVVPQESWRLVGPIESAVGILMFGWSTGIIVAAVQQIYRSRAG
jgi:voltage-gated potassium channel Kch